MSNKWYKGTLDPMKAYEVWKYNRDFMAAHPEYFLPDGILTFCGPQGSGKTISMVQYILGLCKLFPGVVVCSNITIKLPEHIQFIPWTGVECFSAVRNGFAGVIFALDEIHLIFNSLESKKMDTQIFETVSQQRKQRIHIVGTSQVAMRIAKPFREQFKYLVICNKYFNCLQYNVLIDAKKATIDDTGEIIAADTKRFMWFHTPELYESYDTYEVVKKFGNDLGVIKCL